VTGELGLLFSPILVLGSWLAGERAMSRGSHSAA